MFSVSELAAMTEEIGRSIGPGSGLGTSIVIARGQATLPAQSVRLVLDVAAWSWVERQTGLLFDFSADGGNYRRSQLAENATRMRRRAEDAAGAAGLLGFWPDVEVTRLVGGDEVTVCVSL